MRPYSNLKPALKRLGESYLGWIVFYCLSSICTSSFTVTDQFLAMNLFYRGIYLVIGQKSFVWHAFSRWMGQEALHIASGISYSAKTDENAENFDRIKCIDI